MPLPLSLLLFNITVQALGMSNGEILKSVRSCESELGPLLSSYILSFRFHLNSHYQLCCLITATELCVHCMCMYCIVLLHLWILYFYRCRIIGFKLCSCLLTCFFVICSTKQTNIVVIITVVITFRARSCSRVWTTTTLAMTNISTATSATCWRFPADKTATELMTSASEAMTSYRWTKTRLRATETGSRASAIDSCATTWKSSAAYAAKRKSWRWVAPPGEWKWISHRPDRSRFSHRPWGSSWGAYPLWPLSLAMVSRPNYASRH